MELNVLKLILLLFINHHGFMASVQELEKGKITPIKKAIYE